MKKAIAFIASLTLILCACGAQQPISESTVSADAASVAPDSSSDEANVDFDALKTEFDTSAEACIDKMESVLNTVGEDDTYDLHRESLEEVYTLILEEQARLYDLAETEYRNYAEKLVDDMSDVADPEFNEAVTTQASELLTNIISPYTKSIFANDSMLKAMTVGSHHGQEAATEYSRIYTEFVENEYTEQEVIRGISSEIIGQRSGDADASTDFRAVVDAYEECINEYTDFLAKYRASTDKQAMEADYNALMSKYQEFSEKFNDIDTSQLSADDFAYYTEALARCRDKMTEISK